MMRALRRSTKTIMIVVAAAFVIGFIFLQLGVNVTGSGRRVVTALGSVNGVEISPSMYNNMRTQLLTQVRQSKGTIDDEDYMRIEEQVWDKLVYQILLQQEIKRMGIMVSDEEILDEMKNNPPDFLRTNEAFLTDGQFDQAKYLQALYSSQNDAFVLELENWYRNTLPIQKLQDYLFSSIHITDGQIREEFKDRNEKVKVGYLAFNYSDLVDQGRIEVSETEIQDYYQNHRDDFRTEKRVILEYVEFPIVPNREDTLDAKSTVDEVLNLLTDGTPFEEVAKDYSQDPGSAEKGGDLGWIARGKLVKPVEDAAFNLEKGEMSEPVLSQFGYHLIKLEDRRTDEIRGEELLLKHMLIKLEPSYQTVEEINDFARETRELLLDAPDFYALVDSLGLEVKTTRPVAQHEQIDEIGPTTMPTSFAHTQSPGDISDVWKIGERYLFCRIKEILPEGMKSIDDVRSEIEEKIRDEKSMEEARLVAEKALDRIHQTGDLAAVAEEFGVEYKETGEITRRSIVPDVGRYTEFTGVAFGLDTGQTSDLIEGSQGWYILKVLEKQGLDESAFEEAKENIKRERETFQMNTLMGNWYEALKASAEIEDNRDLFFQQS